MRILLIFLLLFTFIYADRDDDRKHHYSKDLRYLKLSSTQKKEMKVILKKYRKEIREFREYKEDLVEEKEKLFIEDILNESKIREINQKISEFSTKIEINFLKEIHNLLSLKQKKRFKKYIEEWEIE
ncbi:MAG TPA: hypothetical protein EYG93_01975 [Sulfurospirillum arcachonense]|nr:hypothetical protein [Sulfurospirillum arcachonense]